MKYYDKQDFDRFDKRYNYMVAPRGRGKTAFMQDQIERKRLKQTHKDQR